MNDEMREMVERLQQCFPASWLNYNNEFIAERNANRRYGSACCRLHECKTSEDIICTVIESLSLDCCKSQPFKTPEANVDFRNYMIAGMNKFLGTSFTERDFLFVHTRLGCAINRRLTIAFVKSCYNLDMLKKSKRVRMISVDQLLEAINGVEYQSQSLEQMRGGNDVLRRLIPKLISQQPTFQGVHIVTCRNCEFFEIGNDAHGLCAKHLCTKHECGWCDSGKEKSNDASK